ncbi:MAG: vWA domain-containing protein [Pseudomonadota bacterium]
MSGSWATERRAWWAQPRFWLLPLMLLLLLTAAVNPTVRLAQPRFDYLFVLDVTQSMNVADVQLNGETVPRLEFARAAIRQSLRRLPCGSKAGLAMFTEHRSLMLFSPVEVCGNVGAFETTLNSLDWRLAWVSRSEVAKGLYSAMRSVTEMEGDIRLVFVTDGHEAPPVPPTFHVPFEQYAEQVDGLVIGVGGDELMPIPVISDEGEVLGYWRAEDVQQLDNYQLGRSGDVEGEGIENAAEVQRLIAAGTEHMSSLREEYLQSIADQALLDYVRVQQPADLVRALRQSRFAEQIKVDAPTAPLLGAVTLVLLLLYLLLPAVRARLQRRGPLGT